MDKVEEQPLPCTSPSVVTFRSQIDENHQSKSSWDPDWTIQREISITIDKSAHDSPKFCSKKILILILVAICVAVILSVVIPIIISNINSQRTPIKRTTTTTRTTIETTQIESNSSTRKFEMYWCENLIYLENVNLIGYDLISKSGMTWSTCCSWCLNVLSCRAFTYETISSKCYLKRMTNDNELFAKGYQSAKYI